MADWTIKSEFKQRSAELAEAEKRITGRLAEVGAKIAAENAPLYTGFYAANIHALPPGSPGVPGKVEEVTDLRGHRAIRVAATIPSPGDRGAIAAAASYSIQVEVLHGPLNRAVESLRELLQQIVSSENRS